jgi:hypothetical protein
MRRTYSLFQIAKCADCNKTNFNSTSFTNSCYFYAPLSNCNATSIECLLSLKTNVNLFLIQKIATFTL